MKHVKLLFLASSLMLSYSALAQEYKQVWSDEFDNLEDKNWNFEEGSRDQGYGNWELEQYHKANASIGMAPDGVSKSLIITAKPDMTSARLYSKDKVSFKYGKLEARIMIPKTANGLWPAFWMLGQKGTWPSCGEIDILEMGHKDGIAKGLQDRYYNGACHWGVYANGSYPNYPKFNTAESSLEDGKFHTFTLEWTPQSIKMYLDNAATPYYDMDISKKSTTNDPGNYFNKEFYVLLNLAIGGTFTGITNASGITALQSGEQKMYVDYVRLYQKEGQECYTINGKKVDNLKEDSGLTDTTTDLGIYGSKSLDANGKSTFDFTNSHDYVLVAVSDGVKDAMGDKIRADYRPGVSTNQMDIWEGTFSANTSDGNNSFGNPESYTDLSVGSKGWSGLGFESPAGLDYSMLDDSYYLHFAMKNDDVAAHNTYSIWIGGAKFALGKGAFPDGNNSYPKIGDFRRDGQWYSFDIPVKALKSLNSSAFEGCNNANFNIFSLLAGGVSGTRVMLDNIFFYKNETKNPDQKPAESDNTQLGEYGYKALNDAGESNFDFSKASDFVIIGASQGVMDQMAGKVKADYSVDNKTQHLYIWGDQTYTATPVTGLNSFGLSEEYTTYTVGNVGWSGLGYAGVKDLSMLDDTYYLHFSVKGDDALAHASHEFGVGKARFTIGNTSMENTMILGDFPRDGKWYSFDIPVSMLKNMANPLFPAEEGGASAYNQNAFCALSGGTQGTKLTFDNVFFFKKVGGTETPDVDATLGKFGSKALDGGKNSTFNIANGSDYVLISTGATFAGKVAAAGKLKADYNVDDTNYKFNLWDGTMTGSTPNGVNSFGFDEDYSCVKVTGSAGWSGAGYAPASSADMSMVDDTYNLHFSMKSTQDAPFAIVVGEKDHFTIGSAPFVDGPKLYPTIGNIYRDGQWYSFDIPMSEIKKYGGTPDFWNNAAYKSNFVSVLAGGTAGVEVNLDGVFFYKPNKTATGVEAIKTANEDAKVLGIFDLSGRKVENMDAKGIYIIKTTQGCKKVMKK